MSEALYRKYRPNNFNQVVGQDNIVRLLRSGIEADSLTHAYLLTGGRGVGKTTIARIIAKELGTAPEDIIELDAASNRGIDDARNLREQMNARPFNSKYKVYILDEAHMLTKEASNALLKTFEEPPSYVKFILCTTNPEKLLPTIRSRCQILKLNEPTKDNILSTIGEINKLEKLNLTESVLNLIAEQNIESYRDAIAELERVASLGLGESGTLQSLGSDTAAFAELVKIVEAILLKDVKSSMLLLADFKNKNRNQTILYNNISYVVRDLLLMKATSDASSLLYHKHPSQLKILNELFLENKEKINSEVLRKILECSRYFSYNLNGYLAIEMTVITMCD